MYCFLIASLPELSLDAPAPMTVQEFDVLCSEELKQEEMAALTAFDGTVTPEFSESRSLNGLYNAYGKFELYLRNRIARQRAEKAGVQLELPEPPESYSEFDFIAGTLANTSDPAEREMMIDALRWYFIEEQLLCKEFHFNALCAYRLKLIIVNKYRDRQLEPGRKRFDAALERLSLNTFRQEQ